MYQPTAGQLSGSLYNLPEFCSVQRCPAHQRSVDVRLPKQGSGIAGFDTAAVQNTKGVFLDTGDTCQVDVRGKLLWQREVRGSRQAKVESHGLAAGLYFLRVRGALGTQDLKVLIR